MTKAMFQVELQAVSNDDRYRRLYKIDVDQTSLNGIMVTVTNGRINAWRRDQFFHVNNLLDAQKLVGRLLLRRLSLPARIGIQYRVVALYDPASWLSDVRLGVASGWLVRV